MTLPLLTVNGLRVPFRWTRIVKPANREPQPVRALSHCLECNDWVAGPCAYVRCPFRRPA